MTDPLLRRLGALLAHVDPVPPNTVVAAEQVGAALGGPRAWDWLDRLPSASVRGASTARFGCGDTMITVQFEPDHLRGVVDPVAEVLVEEPLGRTPAAVDRLGFFRVSRSGGPLRIVVRRDGRAPLATRWFVP